MLNQLYFSCAEKYQKAPGHFRPLWLQTVHWTVCLTRRAQTPQRVGLRRHGGLLFVIFTFSEIYGYIIQRLALSGYCSSPPQNIFIKILFIVGVKQLSKRGFCGILYMVTLAGVVELADAPDSKSGGSDTVTVRPRSPAPKKQLSNRLFFIIGNC